LDVNAGGKKSKEKRNTRWMHNASNNRQGFIAAEDQYLAAAGKGNTI
jgi:hypothetical protein